MSGAVKSPFKPTPDVRVIVDSLLDIFERRDGAPKQVVRVDLAELAADLPGYHSQLDPLPRTTANEQLTELARRGWVRLTWEQGQAGHLLARVILEPASVEPLYALLGRQPLADQRRRLRELLLGDRFRLAGWRKQAVQACLNRLSAGKSPSPFNLTDEAWNRDLLAALIALPAEAETTEIPYRVFSVRLYNDSKRFELLKNALARLARRQRLEWRDLSPPEVLRELGLVANPGHLYLYGPWQLVDQDGQVLSLAGFHPSVGLPNVQAAGLQRVSVQAGRVICVENLASFYELIRHDGDDLAALCLWGNPAPAARHLLRCLARSLPQSTAIEVWADIDYGGLNILAQLRQQVSPALIPHRMDIDTLAAHERWAHPLTPADERNLARLRRHPDLADMIPLIDELLLRGLKLEQEAILLG